MKKENFENSQILPGIHSLYCLAKLAKKQVIHVTIPPTVLIGFNHDNMFLYTKPATKCLTVETKPMTPKLLTYYLKNYMDRNHDEDAISYSNSIKPSVYPKYVMKYSTTHNNFPTAQSISLFYKIQDVCNAALEFWGKYDMAIQPFIISKSRKASMLRYEVYNANMVKSVVLSSNYDICDIPYLSTDKIINLRKDFIYQSRKKNHRLLINDK